MEGAKVGFLLGEAVVGGDVETMIVPLICEIGIPLAVVYAAVPVSVVVPTEKPHIVTEQAPSTHMVAALKFHSSESDPAGTLLDARRREVMLLLSPSTVKQVVVASPVHVIVTAPRSPVRLMVGGGGLGGGRTRWTWHGGGDGGGSIQQPLWW
ncbi:hypothetical protein CYMTET_21153 [Cymbomonas tetramitiformis]|uniref:Uncharacterized protein n=1 Tax=Cymbomonas tetramitiformis TaxID=36881 RepID=A0AAE0G3E1_9CHLO|nr:hypothetical protein CYMTET_21153 [Cymbomonas tetramitiformis]